MAKSKKPKKGGGKSKKDQGPTKFQKYITYIVAFFDFLSAVTIITLAFKMILTSRDWTSAYFLIFSLFWSTLLMVIIFGIWKNRPNCVRVWIVFSCIIIVVESGLVIYGAFKEATINARHMKSVVLLILGLFLETLFMYIVYLFIIQIRCECGKKKKCCSFGNKKDPKCEKGKKKKKKSKK